MDGAESFAEAMQELYVRFDTTTMVEALKDKIYT